MVVVQAFSDGSRHTHNMFLQLLARRLRPGYNKETPVDQLMFLIHTFREVFKEKAFPNNLELLKVLTVMVSSPMMAQQSITLQMC